MVKRPDLFSDSEAIGEVLQAFCSDNIIPEIYDIIKNPRLFFSLLQSLAGVTVRFPPLEHLQSLLIAVDVVLTVSANEVEQMEEVVHLLSKDYGILPRDIVLIYEKARKLIWNAVDVQKDTFIGAINKIVTDRDTDVEMEEAIRKSLSDERRRMRSNVFHIIDGDV